MLKSTFSHHAAGNGLSVPNVMMRTAHIPSSSLLSFAFVVSSAGLVFQESLSFFLKQTSSAVSVVCYGLCLR